MVVEWNKYFSRIMEVLQHTQSMIIFSVDNFKVVLSSCRRIMKGLGEILVQV